MKLGRLNKNGDVVEMTTEELKTREFRRNTRCKKHKHAGVTNGFGVTWCKDCGTLINN